MTVNDYVLFPDTTGSPLKVNVRFGSKADASRRSGMGGKSTLDALSGALLRRQSVIPRIEVTANWLRKANHLF